MSGGRGAGILFCTIVPLDNSSGGTIVCREHLQRIARTPGVKVDVFAPNIGEENATGDFVQSLGATFHPLEWGIPTETGAALRRGCLFGLSASDRFAFMLEKQAFRNWRTDLHFREIFQQVRPDVIVLDYLYTALFLPSAFHCGVPVSVVTLNRERDFYRQQRELARLPADAADSSFAEWRLGRFEGEVYANADSLVVLSPNDIPADPVVAARTTVIEPVLEPCARKWSWADGRNLFFVGNIVHYPNFAAVRWLCESLAPALEKVDPEVTITIVGADATEVPESWNRPNVNLLGRSTQEEVLRQFSSCGLFIAPIENNFGSKIKILECLAHATPLVATAEALTGLPSTEGIPLFSLADPEGAACLAVKLLRSREEAEGLSANLQSLLRSHLARSETAWPALIGRLTAQPAMRRIFFVCSFLRPRDLRAKNPALEVGSNDFFWLRSTGVGPVGTYEGRPIRWTGPQAEITVAIAFRKPPRWMDFFFLEITPQDGTEFRLLANGTEVASGKFCGTRFRRVVRLPRLEGSKELTIRIETPGFQVAGDDRILGVAIESIRLSRHRWRLLTRPSHSPITAPADSNENATAAP
jgi:glycosyltransferase involved in cell wall biosynthesis